MWFVDECTYYEDVAYIPIHMNGELSSLVWVLSTARGGLSAFNQVDRDRSHLIAEAFNVAHETGLTSRQLAEQRAELLAALKELADASRSYIGYMDADDVDVLERARAAVAKATTGGAA